jgi:cytochrome bd-type quinol oxidase subunit 2
MGDARHTRPKGRGGLRRARLRHMSVAMLVMLVIQYGLGIILNLYVEVPASDAHAGILTEIATAPAVLTVHAVLGVALIGTAILLVGTAAQIRDRLLAVLATAGLTTLGGAFGAGEIFVRSGQDMASMAMAVLTGVALLCYIGALTQVSTALRRRGRN